MKKFNNSKELNDAIKSGKVKPLEEVILDGRIKTVLSPEMKRMKLLIKKNYSNENNGNSFLLVLISFAIGMIIYGGFATSWASIVSGALLIGLAIILA